MRSMSIGPVDAHGTILVEASIRFAKLGDYLLLGCYQSLRRRPSMHAPAASLSEEGVSS
jgi:hypothetical protein